MSSSNEPNTTLPVDPTQPVEPSSIDLGSNVSPLVPPVEPNSDSAE